MLTVYIDHHALQLFKIIARHFIKIVYVKFLSNGAHFSVTEKRRLYTKECVCMFDDTKDTFSFMLMRNKH